MRRQPDSERTTPITESRDPSHDGECDKVERDGCGEAQDRQDREAFIRKALRRREQACVFGEYYAAEVLLDDLDRWLEAARVESSTSEGGIVRSPVTKWTETVRLSRKRADVRHVTMWNGLCY